MQRINVAVGPVYQPLVELAERERRGTADQAAVLIVDGLAAAGMLVERPASDRPLSTDDPYATSRVKWSRLVIDLPPAVVAALRDQAAAEYRSLRDQGAVAIERALGLRPANGADGS